MAKQTINNKFSGETGLSSRNKINSNFTELYDGKVDKVTGKGLSDNNYTDTYTGTVRVTAVDIHYEIDSIGSSTEYTK